MKDRKTNISALLVILLVISFLSFSMASCGGGSSTGSDPDPNPDPDPTPTGESFDSNTITTGGSFSYTFQSEGATSYTCTFHPDMEGSVTVEEGADISGEATVTIDDFAYLPQNITVAPGTEITWVNEDDVSHTATSD